MRKAFLFCILALTGIVKAQWSLTGNTGTTPGTNFIGTTDSKDLVFKTNNTEKMRLSTNGRLVFYNSSISPTWANNIYIGGGNEIPSNNAGGVNYANVAVGLGSMNANNTGNSNTAIGFNSLASNTSGSFNVALGVNSLINSTTGNYNVSVGLNALSRLTTGNNNTALGYLALNGGSAYSITGNDNTAVGNSSLRGLGNNSSNNTAIGSNSFILLRTGNNNISVGYNNVTAEIFNANNNIYIGNNLTNKAATPNNELNIGDWIIGNNGTIGIGQFTSALPADGVASDGNKYKLFVKDGIRTEKVKVDIAADNAWADYVFAKDYKLMSLKDIENYITANGHLPEVPSTEEAIKNGIELKEMNILLLKKVEELTLHLIKQDKRIEELEAQNKK
ncbi:hypothetical protein [Epilithonimonas sp.]|uniref:hypothetical protein n=1 Tax=Epilithonimonas sp. TaxID=2894511 RepID=UPI0035B40FA0